MESLTNKQTIYPPKTSVIVRKNKRFVGIVNPGYGYERVSYSLSPKGFKYTRFKTVPLSRLLDRKGTFYFYTPIVLGAGAGLLHTWNALPISTMPFVVSCEVELPRYFGSPSSRQIEFGKRIIYSDRCRRILALSDAAKNALLCKYDHDPDLSQKIEVFRGGVKLQAPVKTKYDRNGPIKLLFVGTDAVRKGLYPLLLACEALRKAGVELNLTIVGGMSSQSYVHKQYAPEHQVINNIINQKSWICAKGPLSQTSVLENFLTHDVVVFPTFDESLGWIPIEAGMLGVPTIATNIFAIPEYIDHKQSGYLINIEKRKDQRFVGLDTEGEQLEAHIDKANNDIIAGLVESITYLYDNREVIEEWGTAAKTKTTGLYNVEQAGQKLSDIYKKCW